MHNTETNWRTAVLYISPEQLETGQCKVLETDPTCRHTATDSHPRSPNISVLLRVKENTLLRNSVRSIVDTATLKKDMARTRDRK